MVSKGKVGDTGILEGVRASEAGDSKSATNNSDDAFGSDDELPDESIEDRLSWRKDHSFSDWKIIITVSKRHADDEGEEDEGEEERGECESASETKEYTYNVHRQNLAVGPRRSDYFVRLFENGHFAESQDNTSRIELGELAAEAFPEMLDYMYMTGQKTTFTTEHATALFSLSKYFDVRRLRREVKQFCLKDMRQAETCGTYYEHATILQEESILTPATKYCRDNIYYISFSSRLLHVSDPQFWLDLMEDRVAKGSMLNVSKKLSIHIAIFCQNHKVSPEVFQQLTDERYFVENGIHPMAAMYLLYWEQKLLGKEDDDDDDDDNDQSEGCGELSSLQMRCVNTIVRNKDGADLKGSMGSLLLHFPPLVLREIITRLAYGIE